MIIIVVLLSAFVLAVDRLAPAPAAAALDALETIGSFDADGNLARFKQAMLPQVGQIQALPPKIADGEQKRAIVRAQQAYLGLATLREAALTDYIIEVLLTYRSELLRKYQVDSRYIDELKGMGDKEVRLIKYEKILMPVFANAAGQVEQARKLAK